MSVKTNIPGYELIQTSNACPEQYDVYNNGKIVGYLRLRNGYFRADCIDCYTTMVYEAWPTGDGIFKDEEEREFYLIEAIKQIKEKCHEKD